MVSVTELHKDLYSAEEIFRTEVHTGDIPGRVDFQAGLVTLAFETDSKMHIGLFDCVNRCGRIIATYIDWFVSVVYSRPCTLPTNFASMVA